jgi:ammonia channel protein AmtB
MHTLVASLTGLVLAALYTILAIVDPDAARDIAGVFIGIMAVCAAAGYLPREERDP